MSAGAMPVGDLGPERATVTVIGRWAAPLVTLLLWVFAVWQMMVSVPGMVHAAQRFMMKLPWYTELVWGTPVWAVAAAGVAFVVLASRARGAGTRAAVLTASLAANLAIHLSVYGAQAKLVWGLVH